ncbi:MAG TPA: RlmE family RNA methyltransferase [Coxiellaceae bacterium]|nr:RlmE family RNA methyltransferase [Coxiellaceae bacterium]
MKKNKTWIERHLNDPFVKASKREGYASRAAYKLLAIQEKDKILKRGMTVIDLGAAPGGWSQVAVQCVGDRGRVIAIDVLPMDVPADVTFIQGDFNDDVILQSLEEALRGEKADVILSDMAPNISGQRGIDMPRSIHLLELALDCAQMMLAPGGTLLLKAFQGAGLEAFVQSMRAQFSSVKYRKPEASRATSAELYLLALGFQGRYNESK